MKKSLSTTTLLVAGLTFVAVFILRDVLFFGKAFYERDILWFYFAEVEAFVRAIAEGALPLRDATMSFGQPIVGNPASEALYPLTWLNLILRPDLALSIILLCHFVIGGTGAMALCSRLSGSSRAAFFAGAFWIASGPFQSALNLWHHFAGAAWMPWVLVGFDRLLERPSVPRTLGLSALFGIQILAGSADLCAMTVLLALLRLLCEGREIGVGLTRRACMIGLAILVALSLGAGTWMSAIESVRSSARSGLSRAERTEWSVHPWTAIEMVAPFQFGSLPFTPEIDRRVNADRAPLLKSIFLGALVLPLVVAALANSRVRRRYRVFLGIGVLTTGLVALGSHSPVYDLLMTLMPPLRLFRYPVKAMLPLSLLASVLSGLGVEAAEGKAKRGLVLGACLVALVIVVAPRLDAGDFFALLDPAVPRIAAEAMASVFSSLFWAGAALAVFAAAVALGRPAFIPVSVAVGLCVSLLVNQDINPTIPSEVIRYRPAYVNSVREGEIGRLYAFDYVAHPQWLPQVFDWRLSLPAEALVVAVRGSLMSPAGGEWGIEYGWEKDYLGLFDHALRDLSLRMRNVQDHATFLRLLEIANMRRVAVLHDTDTTGLVLERSIPMPMGVPLRIYQVPNALPRAYAVSGVRRLSNTEAVTAILDPRFDPRAEVILDDGLPTGISPSFRAQVDLVERRSDRITLEATLNEPGEVVLVDGYLSGWKATVDGAPASVSRANAVFLATKVPAGRHRIVFAYRPWLTLLGMTLTLLTALTLLVAGLFLRRRRPVSSEVWTNPDGVVLTS